MLRFALALTLITTPALAQSTYPASATAQAHCPGDTIVWLNAARHMYRMPGEKGYGRAKNSGFACLKEAEAAGDKLKVIKPKS